MHIALNQSSHWNLTEVGKDYQTTVFIEVLINQPVMPGASTVKIVFTDCHFRYGVKINLPINSTPFSKIEIEFVDCFIEGDNGQNKIEKRDDQEVDISIIHSIANDFVLDNSVLTRITLSRTILFRQLNEFMSLAFKFNLIVPDKIVEKYSKLSPYYEWLLNMENFNYKDFNPLWVTQYVNAYYMKKIFNLQVIKNSIKTFLKINPQPYLATLYAIHG